MRNVTMAKIPHVLLLIFAGLSASRAQGASGFADRLEPNELNKHAIAINSEGRALDPTIALKKHRDVLLTRKGYERQTDMIFAGIEKQAREGKLKKKAVLLWVHGGNNFITGAIKRADELSKPISDDGYYPVSICWSSNIPSAWWEQMRYVRNGVYFKGQNDAWAIVTAPVYIATDIITAIVRFPRTALDKLYSTLKPVAPHAYDKIKAGQFRYQALQARERQFGYRSADPDTRIYYEKEGQVVIQQKPSSEGSKVIGRAPKKVTPDEVAAKWWPLYAKDKPMTVSQGKYAPTIGDSTGRVASYFATLPTKTAVLSVFATLGESSWDMLNRRCKAMIHHTNSFRPDGQATFNETDADLHDSETTGVGALAVFLRRLELFCREHPDIKVVAIGHSMGAIVLNEAIRSFPRVPYRDIVYMAAACSVRDFDASVVPYLRAHKQTQFYNLCLNPRAEDREDNLYDLVPRGSFLVWIDEFLNHPQSFPDRTLGNFENVMLASKMFHPKVHGQLHMSAMGAGPGQPDPQKHGDFSAKEFWKEEFWKRRGWDDWPPRTAEPAGRRAKAKS